MTVPYTFANATGNIPLAELDANFANVGGYANTSGTVTTNAQPNITTVGTLAYLSSTGNISATYFIGNGSQLTGIVANSSYSNANVQSYLPTYTGTLAGGNIVTTGRIQALGNVSGNFFVGNGSQLTGITGNYSNTNVASYLTTYTGNFTGNIVTANFFIGDGSGLTNLPASNYSNSNVANYLPTYSGDFGANTINAVGEITTFSNVVVAPGGYFLGDGSQLTNLPAGNYGNSNVEAYLPSSNTIILINSNVANTDSNVANLTNALANTNSNVANLTTALGNTDANVANLVTITTNTDSNVGNLALDILTLQGEVYSNANVANYLPVYSGNISSNNISITTQANIVNLNVTGLANLNSNANIYISGGISGQSLVTDGTGNLTWQSPTVGNINTVDGSVTGNATLDFTYNTTTLIYLPTSNVNITLSNFTAGHTARVIVRYGATPYPIDLGVGNVQQTTEGTTTIPTTGGGGHNINGNQSVQLLYTCFDNTADNCYVTSTFL